MKSDSELLLADLDRVAAALRQIKKARATWANYKRAEKKGIATAEQMSAARAVLSESVRESLELAAESAVGLSQLYGNNLSESVAADLIS